MSLRRADAGDVRALVELVESAYRGDASREGWTTEADLLEGRRLDAEMALQVIEDPDGAILVADADADADGTAAGSLVACCQVRDLGEGRGYLGMFAVRPGAQGRGLGSRVLAEAEAYAARRWNLSRIQMQVIEQREELIAYYLRRGYRDTGEKNPFPYGDERFGQPQREDLAFSVLAKDL